MRIINLSSTCNRDVIMHVCFIVLIRVLSRESGRIVIYMYMYVMCFLSMISYVVLCGIWFFFFKPELLISSICDLSRMYTVKIFDFVKQIIITNC